MRRRFVKRFENEGSPIAKEMLRQIAARYGIEKTVRGREAAIRLAARRDHSDPIIAALNPWLEAPLSRIPQKSRIAEDIRYTLAHWPGLICFLDDGTLERDTNPVENQVPPIALTRKNALFAGNKVGAGNRAMLASLIATSKMSGVNPLDDLTDTLRAILDGHPKARIEDLMPWHYNLSPSLAAQGHGVAITLQGGPASFHAPAAQGSTPPQNRPVTGRHSSVKKQRGDPQGPPQLSARQSRRPQSRAYSSSSASTAFCRSSFVAAFSSIRASEKMWSITLSSKIGA